MPRHLTERDIIVSDTEPLNPNEGQMWINLTEGFIKRRENGIWVDYSYASKDVVAGNVIDIEVLKKQMEDLMYKPITINSFGNNRNTVEKGTIITDTVLNWSINKTPVTLSLDGVDIDVKTTSFTDNKEYMTNRSFKLIATDERNARTEKTTSVTFLNCIYYGVSASVDYSNELLMAMTKTVSESKGRTFTVNCGPGQFIYYSVPSRLGNCTFKVGGFDGGFDKVATIQHTNSKGFIENYDIYRSTNADLGNTTVTVA